ncbi:DUF7710 domain-containing protein [Aliiroseovarius sp.]|uniref:DUF7710 domain-containing protein n=1 Tax=Aliiroseovarius sp. TaxID=1872442 RepID=UPI003BABBCEB
MSTGQQVQDEGVSFVWVFMSEFSAKGMLGAPSAIFSSQDQAEVWVAQSGLSGILYRFPLDVSLSEYSEPINGNQPFITKHQDKSSLKYKAGNAYLGFLPHTHFDGS